MGPAQAQGSLRQGPSACLPERSELEATIEASLQTVTQAHMLEEANAVIKCLVHWARLHFPATPSRAPVLHDGASASHTGHWVRHLDG
jgi:hypothetical protein